MATFTEAVQRITIESRTQGVVESTQQVKQLGQSQNELAQISGKVETATGRQEQALLRSARAAQLYQQQTQQLTAANDNASRSWQAANDNMKTVGGSFLSTAEGIITTTAHLKLVALAAYALSPAFRAVTNSGIVAAISLIGPAATNAARSMLSFASPALSFFTRIALPIGIVVAAWQALNAIINTGSGLIEKYGNATRALFGENVDENLKKLTKLQTDTISLEQVHLATELGVRLNEAKRTIGEFFAVQFDLTDPALKLQSAWVRIVEAIAKALSILGNIPSAMAEAAQAIGNSSLWDKLNFGWNLPGKQRLLEEGGAGSVSNDEALRLAKSRLAAGMGGGFVGRFTQSINDLANPPKQEEKASGEFERLANSIERATAAQEANAKTVEQTAGEQAKLRTEFRLTEAAQQDIAKNGGNIADYYDRIQKAAQRAGEAAQMVEKARVDASINFGRQTAFLTPQDVQIAQQLKGLYGNDIPKALASTEAAGLRLNEELRQTRDLMVGFASDFAGEFRNQLRQGVNAWQAFGAAGLNALQRLEDKLIDMALQNLVSKALGGSGFNLFNLFGAAGGGSISSIGGSGLSAGVTAFHSGGTIGINGSPRYVHPAYFDDAPRMHSGGSIDWAAGERPIIGLTGERMLNRQETASYGKPPVLNQRVIINNYGADVQQTTNQNGDLELTVRSIARDEMASPRSNGISEQKFGQRPRLRAR